MWPLSRRGDETYGSVGCAASIGCAGQQGTDRDRRRRYGISCGPFCRGCPVLKALPRPSRELLILCDESVSAEQVNKYCFEQGVILNKLQVKRKSLETDSEITGNKATVKIYRTTMTDLLK